MSQPNKSLPAGFEDLQPFATAWSLPTEDARANQRRASSPEELKAFYDAMLARLAAIVEYLNGFPLDKMPEDARRLFYLLLSLAEIAPNIELYSANPLVPYSFDETLFKAVHGNRAG